LVDCHHSAGRLLAHDDMGHGLAAGPAAARRRSVVSLNGETWHLDKRIPVALIVAFIAQTLAIGIWVGTIATRVDSVESWISENRRIDSRLAVLENQLGDIKDLLQRLAAQRDRNGP